MLENMKELSDRATPGEIKQPDWGSDLRAGKTLIGMMSPVPEGNGKANGAYLCRLWNDHRTGHLHDDTALATAVARARREALEEAAAHLARKANSTAQWGGHLAAGVVADCVTDILSLAATSPEARQTETEWDAAVALFRATLPDWTSYRVEAETARGMTHFRVEIARLADTDDGQERAYGRGDTPLGAMQDALASVPAPPPPAIGNLEGEGRSHG